MVLYFRLVPGTLTMVQSAEIMPNLIDQAIVRVTVRIIPSHAKALVIVWMNSGVVGSFLL